MIWGLLILLAVSWSLLMLIGAAIAAHTLTHPPRWTEGTAIARREPTVPAEMALTNETQRLTTRTGHEIELWVIHGERPDGPAVMMLHGWGDSRIGELRWVEMFRPLVSSMILFDQRGHGYSADPVYTWGLREADDAEEVIRWARGHTRKPVVLFGSSMGAWIALRAAARMGDVIRGVIAYSPPASLREEFKARVRLMGLPVWPIAPMAITWLRWLRRMPSPIADPRNGIATHVSILRLYSLNHADIQRFFEGLR